MMIKYVRRLQINIFSHSLHAVMPTAHIFLRTLNASPLITSTFSHQQSNLMKELEGRHFSTARTILRLQKSIVGPIVTTQKFFRSWFDQV